MLRGRKEERNHVFQVEIKKIKNFKKKEKGI